MLNPRAWTWWTRRLAGQQIAVRNARLASAALAQRRLEHDEVEAYLAALNRRSRTPA